MNPYRYLHFKCSDGPYGMPVGSSGVENKGNQEQKFRTLLDSARSGIITE